IRVDLANAIVTATDPDADDTIRFSITDGNPASPLFFVNDTSGQLSSIRDQLDFETQSEYRLTITARDKGGLTSLSTVVVSVLDLNESPTVKDVLCSVMENATTGTTVCRVEASDPDTSDKLSGVIDLSLTASDSQLIPAFTINPVTATIVLLDPSVLDFETQQVIQLSACATDRGSPPLRSCGNVTIQVLDSNDAPTLISPSSCSVPEIAYDLSTTASAQYINKTVCSLRVQDPDETSEVSDWRTHVWESSAVTSCPFSVDASTGHVIITAPEKVDFESLKSCSLSVRATDRNGLSSAWQSVAIRILDINERPNLSVSVLEIDENVAVGTLATGDSPQAFDPDWLEDGTKDTPDIRLEDPRKMFAMRGNSVVYIGGQPLDFETVSDYFLGIYAVDRRGLDSQRKVLRIRVRDINEAPVFDSDLPRYKLEENQPRGSRLSPPVRAGDPDRNDIVRYALVMESSSFAQAATPTTFDIDAVSGILFQTASVVDFEATPTFTLTVQATDRLGLTTLKNVTVDILNVNEAPTVKSSHVTVPEDLAPRSMLGLPLGALTTDPELPADNITFSIRDGNEQRCFELDPVSGQLRLLRALDFERTSLYSLVVRATDRGGLFGEATIVIQVTDVSEPPAIHPFEFSMLENSAPGVIVGGPLNASDPDIGTVLTYRILRETGRETIASSSCFSINATNGQLSVASRCLSDFEDSLWSLFSVQIEVSDGNLTATATGYVRVLDVNEPPVFDVESPRTFELQENSRSGTHVGSVWAVDPDYGDLSTYEACGQSHPGTFAVQSERVRQYGTAAAEMTANIVVLDPKALNFEAQPTLWIDVCARDKGDLSVLTRVSITLLNVFEPPRITLDFVRVTVREDATNGTVIGPPLSQFVVDEENLNPAVGCTVALGIINTTCLASVVLSIDACGQLSLRRGVFDFEMQSECSVDVAVLGSSSDYFDPSQRISVEITVLDVNEAPSFTTHGVTMSIAESAVTGTILGFLSATDPDNQPKITFAWGNSSTVNTSSLPFALGSTTGAISLRGAGLLNFEARRVYEAPVVVADQWGLMDQSTIVVNIIDSNEPPVFRLPLYTFNIAENQPSQTVIGTVVAIDSDSFQNTTLTYSIVSGNDLETMDIASVSGNGVLLVKNVDALDYERQTKYELVVSSCDNGPGALCGFTTVRVLVGNVNEAPAVRDAVVYVAENVAIGSVLWTSTAMVQAFNASMVSSDPDSGDKLTYSLRDDSLSFTIDSQTGVVSTSKALDFETIATYSLRLTAVDSGGLQASGVLTVIVLDRNDAPRVVPIAMHVTENSGKGTVCGQLQRTDQDVGQTHMFSIQSTALQLRDKSSIVRPNNDVVELESASSGVLRVFDASVLDYENVTTIALSVIVQDNGSPAMSSEVTIISIRLQDMNEACTIPPQSFVWDENAVGIVGVVQAIDPDTFAEEVAWRELRFVLQAGATGDEVLSIDDASGALSAVASIDYERVKKITRTVVATDGAGLSCRGSVTIAIRDVNEAPVVASSTYWVSEADAIGSGVFASLFAATAGSIPDGRVFAWDPENDTLTFVQEHAETSSFRVDPVDGSIHVQRVLDFKAAASHQIVVNVTDTANHSTSVVLTIVILDVNEPPVFHRQPSFMVEENAAKGMIVGAIQPAVDPDQFDVIAYDLVSTVDSHGVSVDLFSLKSCDGEIRVAPDALGVIDFEKHRSFTIIVRARDRKGLSAISAPIMISIVDVNEPPRCIAQTLLIDENSATNTTVGRLQWEDPDTPSRNFIRSFEITNPKSDSAFGVFAVDRRNTDEFWLVVRNAARLDFEQVPRFELMLTITDRFVPLNSSTSTSSLASSCVITVQLRDINEPPRGEVNASRSIRENLPALSLVGAPVFGQDADAGDSVRFSLVASSNGTDAFSIDAVTGQLRTRRVLNFEVQTTFSLAVQVQDTSNLSVLVGVTINVEDVNEPPRLPRNCYVGPDNVARERYDANQQLCLYVDENLPIDSILARIVAQDEDTAQRLSFSVSSSMSNLIRLVSDDRTSGNRSCDVLATSQAFDYERQRIHRFRLTVTDTGVGFLSDTVDVVLFVGDVNEPPVLLSTSTQLLQLEENAPAGVIIAQLQALDPEGDAVVFRLSQVTSVRDAIVITEDGTVLSSNVSCDFEALKAQDVTNQPALTVRGLLISSASNASVPFSFVIPVIDVDEAPAFLRPLFEFAVHELSTSGTMVGVVRATDVDAGDSLEYSLVAEAYGVDHSALFTMDATS
ncbi:hypothetical protein PINS_up010827, partial [Pythium insidiosum]